MANESSGSPNPIAGRPTRLIRASPERGVKSAHTLNSDDMLLPDAVAAAVQHLTSHPEYDLVYGRASSIDAEDNVIALSD